MLHKNTAAEPFGTAAGIKSVRGDRASLKGYPLFEAIRQWFGFQGIN